MRRTIWKSMSMPALLLALALCLTGCGAGTGENTSEVINVTAISSETNESSAVEAESDEADKDIADAADSADAGEDAADAAGTGDSVGEEAAQTDAASSAGSSVPSVIPDGFTERDFDTSYSDYETISLTGNTATTTAAGVTVSDGLVTITEPGNYLLTGEMDGQILIEVPGTEDKVQLVLDNATITNSTGAAIYVRSADKVFLTTSAGSMNTLSSTGSFVQTDENAVDGTIFSKGDLVLNGEGTLVVSSAEGHAIVSKDDLKITSGTYTITAAQKGLSANDLLGIADGNITITSTDDGLNTELDAHILGGNLTVDAAEDGVHADATLTIDGGTLAIHAAEGLESTVITINDGEIEIDAEDDGINASQKVTDYEPALEINGGSLTVSMAAGDTDALDSNGTLYIRGGVVRIYAQSPVDYDYGGEITGGEVYVNDQQVTELYTQMMGGMGGGMGGGWGGGPGGAGGPRPGGQGGWAG